MDINDYNIGDYVFNVNSRNSYCIVAITDKSIYLINSEDWDAFWIHDVAKRCIDWDYQTFNKCFEKSHMCNSFLYNSYNSYE